jgi:membrane protein YdbS with pleckstrin-like domain
MDSSNQFPFNQPFKPASSLVIWQSVDFILFFLLIMSFTVFTVLLAAGPESLMLVILAIIVLVPVLVFFVWVGLYYKSMWYEFREDEINWKRGVWFRQPVLSHITLSPILMSGRGRSCGSLGSLRLRFRLRDIPAR